MKAKVGAGPPWRVIQLPAAKGIKLHRTNALRLSFLAMKSATGGQYA
jgi:hypothetical protein